MKNLKFVLSFVAVCAMLTSALAQPTTTTPPTKKEKGPKVSTTKAPKDKPAKKTEAPRWSGIISGAVTKTGFTLAVPNKGKFTVTVGRAPIADKKGKKYTLAELRGGDMVSVEGTAKGQTIDATKVTINYDRPESAKKTGEKKETTKKEPKPKKEKATPTPPKKN